MTAMSTITAITGTQLFDATVCMFETPRDVELPYWGSPINTERHPAWHAPCFTLEQACCDGLTEEFTITREVRASFALRQRQLPVPASAPEEDIRAKFVVRYRHGILTPQVWSLMVTNHYDDRWASRSVYRPMKGCINHSIGSSIKGPFYPVDRNDSTTIELIVSRLRTNLPFDMLKTYLVLLAHA